MYSISFDPGRRLIAVERSGFPDLDTVMRYERDIRERIASIATGGEPFDVLLDTSRGGVLSQEAAEVIERVLTLFAEAGLRRLAVFNRSAITTMQTRRLVGQTVGRTFEQRDFTELADAETWLREAG